MTWMISNPGQYALKANMTVEEATAVAGGLTKEARIGLIEVLHKTPDGVKHETVNLKRVREGKDSPTVLKPGDSVVVPVKKSGPDLFQAIAAIASLGWALLH